MPLDQNNEHVVPIGGNLVELPVDDATAVPIGTRAFLVAGVDGAGDSRFLSIDTATGALNVAAAVTITPPADTTATGALGALNAVVAVAMVGKTSAGFQIDAGTLNSIAVIGEASFDGGTTWNNIDILYTPPGGAGQFSLTNALNLSGGGVGVGVAVAGTLLVPGGATDVRLRVAVYTAGTSNATVTATDTVPDILGTVMWSVANFGATATGGLLPITGNVNATVLGSVPVTGFIPHDDPWSPIFFPPVLMGGYASATAPAAVSADGDAVAAWFLLNGAQATALTAAGALIGGDAANGLDVDVTRMPATAAPGAAIPALTVVMSQSDGTNARVPRVFDVDTGAGTEYVSGVNLRRSASGGSTELLGQTTMALSLPVAIASDQTAIPISGTVTATISAIGSTGAAVPATAIQVGASDGTNLQAPRVFDLDSGGGTEYSLGVNLRRTGAGASVELLGQTTMANSLPVAIASDQAAFPVTISAIGSTGAAVPATAIQVGASDGTNLQAPRVFDGDTGGGTEYSLGVILRRPAGGGSVEAGTTANPLAVAGTAAANAALSGNPVLIGESDGTNVQVPRVFDVDSGAGTQYVSGVNLRRSASGGSEELLGQTTMAKSVPVVFASDQTILPGTLANGTQTTVDNTAGGVQLIAANANRKGLIIQNTGSNNIRVGVSGVTNTTGFRLTAGASITWSGEGTPTNAIFAIREGATNSTGLAQETT